MHMLLPFELLRPKCHVNMWGGREAYFRGKPPLIPSGHSAAFPNILGPFLPTRIWFDPERFLEG